MDSHWEVEVTDEFTQWWEALDDPTRDSIAHVVDQLEDLGPHLGFPASSAIIGSRHTHLRELRIQHRGQPYRIIYAFDPRRCAILLLGGTKAGDDRWYRVHVPRAESLYDEHLRELRREGLIDDR